MKNHKLRDRTVDTNFLLTGKHASDDNAGENSSSQTDEGADNIGSNISEAKGNAGSIVKPVRPDISAAAPLKARAESIVPAKPANDEKVNFMSHLSAPSHKTFTALYIDIKPEVRAATRKALTQSEMVEVLIQFAAENCKDDTSALIAIAEDKINTRPNK